MIFILIYNQSKIRRYKVIVDKINNRNITSCFSVKPQTSNHCSNINVGWIAIHFSFFIFIHYNVHCYSCLSSDNTNKYDMILSTHTRGCAILNIHIWIGFKYHEYYRKRCLTGNYMFSSEHEISDISKLHFHSCIWGRRGRDRMVVRFTATCAISAYQH